MPITPFQDEQSRQLDQTVFPMQTPTPEEIMGARGQEGYQLNQMGPNLQQLQQIQQRLEQVLSDESLSKKEFSEGYRIKMQLDAAIDGLSKGAQGGQPGAQTGMLSQLTQGRLVPQQGPAPSVVPLSQYGAPMPQQQQGFSGVPSSGLLRGMM